MTRSFDPAPLFTAPLRDLGELTPGMEGILIPEPEIGLAPVGVTDQFLGDAESYHERFTDTERFHRLLAAALERVDLAPGPATVLDVGSGSGNTVLPCLELLPDAHVVAVDISPDLLRILCDHIEADSSMAGRVTPVCMSATTPLFAEGRIDLATGAAILHHLIDPGEAITAVGQALRAGGSAVFFEPMEGGHGLLKLAYAEILEERKRHRPRWRAAAESEQEASAYQVLEAMVAEFELRTGSNKSNPIYAEVDDKWLFTRANMEHWAERGGFSKVRIDPLNDHPDPLTRHTKAILRLAKGLDPEALPDWAWQRIALFETAFSDEARRDLLIEGCITLTK